MGNGCSHGNGRQRRKVGTLEDASTKTYLEERWITRMNTGEYYRIVDENKTEEQRLGTDLFIELVHGASKSGSVEDFVCFCSTNLLKCYK
jgi:hypothetical protein